MFLNDNDVRKLLMEDLIREYKDDPDTRIINELGIDFGASRVDIVVVNGILHGYEIKSDLDTLERLPRQMAYYNKLFERMTIVVSRKHYEKVRCIVPKWWGIKIISADAKRLIVKRKGRLTKNQDKKLLLKLLWKDELEELVDVLGLPKKLKRYKKNQLLEIFYQEADIDVVKKFTYQVLKTRQNWRN